MKYKLIIGQKFNRLTVLSEVDPKIRKDGTKLRQWQCKCECGNIINVSPAHLFSNNTKSCGCLNIEISKDNFFKYVYKEKELNKYSEIKKDTYGEYVIGYTKNTLEKFYVDLDDFDKIKNYTWVARVKRNLNGFKQLSASINGKNVLMHQFLGFKNYDHIDRNELNNRKSNLRKCTKYQNSLNRSVGKNNDFGIIGVSKCKDYELWVSRITYNKKTLYLGSFKEKDDAIKARLEAEAKYFGEYAPQIDLFEQYGIEKPKIKSLADEVN